MVLAEGVIETVDGPDDGEVGLKLEVELERSNGAVDGQAPRPGIGGGERAELELRAVEQIGHQRHQAQAGIRAHLLEQVEVVLVDFVRVVRLDPHETLVHETDGDLQPLLHGLVGGVTLVETAPPGGKEPDARGEAQVELKLSRWRTISPVRRIFWRTGPNRHLYHLVKVMRAVAAYGVATPRCARATRLCSSPPPRVSSPGRARADRRGILQRNDDPTWEVPDVARREELHYRGTHACARRSASAR